MNFEELTLSKEKLKLFKDIASLDRDGKIMLDTGKYPTFFNFQISQDKIISPLRLAKDLGRDVNVLLLRSKFLRDCSSPKVSGRVVNQFL
ncbi:MAG: hypothetical protein GF353_14865 [Candidatus Lokiarchaeota archaeon]|nr:hypothetical protein [Candidatus Lokiarchaeota archaeon]